MSGIRLTFVNDEHSSLNPGVTAALSDLMTDMSRPNDVFSSLRLISTGVDDFGRIPACVEHHDFPYAQSSRLKRIWRLPEAFEAGIDEIIRKSDVVHLHGIWLSAQYYAAKLAVRHGKPLVVSVHGILSPWLWRYQGRIGHLKKWLYWHAMIYPLLKQAAVIHAITPREAEYLRHFFPGNRIVVIPNAIDSETLALAEQESAIPERIILFLGRLHPVKGADLVIRAFAEAKLDPPWKLVLVGPEGDPHYLAALKRLVLEAGLSERVSFQGPVYSAAKFDWYRRAWVLAMPSHSEVIGMVNLEAAACQTPSITTRQTGLFNWAEGGGLLIEPEIDQLAAALRQCASWGDVERKRHGERSLALVRDYYSWGQVGEQWRGLYKELVT